jgi:hypothetical protein
MENNGENMAICPSIVAMKGAYLLELFGVICFMFLGCQE